MGTPNVRFSETAFKHRLIVYLLLPLGMIGVRMTEIKTGWCLAARRRYRCDALELEPHTWADTWAAYPDVVWKMLGISLLVVILCELAVFAGKGAREAFPHSN